ncbi:MAG: AAA family ATPase [Coleofasciculus sp. A1-SPW-01]|uniref:AAA family ATPase n=1 Tax=Coleofasciculus sp. A1-SPW-01 TaxID=3070819 RepID=UPI0032F8063B
MAVTLRASKQGVERVDHERRKKGWAATAAAWYQDANTTQATLKRFRRGLPIQQDAFIGICQAVGIKNWQEIVDDSPPSPTDSRPEFFAYNEAWVGREQLVTELSEKLRGRCRLLLLVGITGIGKTALAERLAVELQDWFQGDWQNNLRRANFDYQDKTTDFASVAARWLEEWGERLSAEEKQPERLLSRLIKHLHKNQVLVLIDSLERLLTGNEEEGWGNFADEWWLKFFLSLLSAESCQSRLIVTSQDLPIKLVDSRYSNFWHRQIVYGLDESEQVALFEKTGLDIRDGSTDKSLLLRIGKVYRGHPLVLRVIIGEINSEPFFGNVQAYWEDCGDKIEEVENALAEAEAGKNLGEQDNWKLHTLTKELRIQVNKRLEATFDRLKRDGFDAYILLCAASVYRYPEKDEYWLKHLVQWVRRLENQECSEERQNNALDKLSNCCLVEESINHNNRRTLGQHDLIRSVAIAHRRRLLESFKNGV